MTDRAAAWDADAWAALRAELARWQDAGRTATLWWRDDDAGQPDPAFERLLALATATAVPVGLAVVPLWLTPEVAHALRTTAAPVTVLQHGFAHRNHEPTPPPGTPLDAGPGARRLRPAECGAARPAAVVLAELTEGWRRLRAAVGTRALPVLVPPWNRIAPTVCLGLPAAGYRGLSAFGRRAGASPAGLPWLNCHVDPVAWRDGNRWVGAALTLDGLRRELADQRTGTAEAGEPVGLLTHHRIMSPAWSAFLGELLPRLRDHPAVAWPPPEGLFG